MAEVLEEFLVSLGFRVEPGQKDKFNQAITGATKDVTALAAAVTAASATITTAVVAIGQKFDALYSASNRINASTANIKGMAYAVSQLGGSYDGAMQSMDNFAAKMRNNPGYESMVRQLGVTTKLAGKARDTVDVFQDVISQLEKRPRHVAITYLDALGIDEKTFDAARGGKLKKYMEDYSDKMKAFRVDMKEAAGIGNELSTSLRSLSGTFEAMGAKLEVTLAPALTKWFKQIDAFLQENGGAFSKVLEDMGAGMDKLAGAMGGLTKASTPGLDAFKQMMDTIGGVQKVMEVFMVFVVGTWLPRIAAAFAAAGLAWATMLLKFGLNPAGAAALLGYGAYSAWDSQQDFNKRADAIERPGGRNPFEAIDKNIESERVGRPQSDKRSWWQRIMPKWAGGQDAPAAAPGVQPSGSGGRRNEHFTRENADAIRAAAKELGVSPEDLATVISYETGGKFDPSIRGGAGNRHIGLIQFGRQEQNDHKASTDQTFPEQMTSVVDYLKKRGFKPGMGLLDLYSTINAGRPGLYNRSDAGNGGAPGTVADKVGTMGPHAARARMFLQSGADTASAPADAGNGGAAAQGGHQEAYRRKTGRDLQADINSKDPYVREWAAKEAGLTPNAKTDGGSVKMPSFGERVREADRQTDMGRVQSYEDAIAQAGANVGKIEGGGLSGPGSALTPPPGSTSSTTISMPQETTINVQSGGDARETASAVAGAQDGVNSRLLRSFEGATR